MFMNCWVSSLVQNPDVVTRWELISQHVFDTSTCILHLESSVLSSNLATRLWWYKIGNSFT